MNIEVKRNIEIEDVLGSLKNTMEYGSKEINREMLEDTIHVIEVLVKKNKQLRDINKNLNEKLERRNATISDLTNQVGELNTLMFEMQIPAGKCDCGNKCCCEQEGPTPTNPIPIEIQKLKSLQDEESGDKKEEPTLQDVLNELEVLSELVVISKLIGIL